METTTKKIYEAIPAIMDEIGHIGKEKRNQQQGFMFRGIDQVMNTMKPLLAKHGVFVVPEVIDRQREERTTKSGSNLIYSILTVRYHFCASDGSEVVATTVGEGMDSADKASNKAMAIAFKYACFQVFCIPTEEIAKDDPDNYSQEESVRADLKNILEAVPLANTIDELNMLFSSLTRDEQVRQRGIFTARKNQILTNKSK